MMDPDRRTAVSQDMLDKLILDMIVESKLPFMIVERPKFRRLFKRIVPERKVMGRKKVNKRVKASYKEMKSNLKAELAKVDWVATTADAWKCHGR